MPRYEDYCRMRDERVGARSANCSVARGGDDVRGSKRGAERRCDNHDLV